MEGEPHSCQQCLLSMPEALSSIPSTHISRVLWHIHVIAAQEVDTGGSEGQGYPWIHREFKISLEERRKEWGEGERKKGKRERRPQRVILNLHNLPSVVYRKGN